MILKTNSYKCVLEENQRLLGASSWMNCRKDSSIIKEKHINFFERFMVYGLTEIQRDSKYPIACVPEYSRNFLSAQHFYLQSKDHF